MSVTGTVVEDCPVIRGDLVVVEPSERGYCDNDLVVFLLDDDSVNIGRVAGEFLLVGGGERRTARLVLIAGRAVRLVRTLS